MSEGLGTRIAQLRAARNLSVQDLAFLTGLSHAELLSLENNPRRKPTAETLLRLANCFHTTAEYLTDGEEPSPAALRAGFFRFYETMSPADRKTLKYAPIQSRVETVLRYLQQSYPTLYSPTQTAARLGYTPEALQDVLRNTAPLESHLLKLLAGLAGIHLDFLVRGDFFGGAVAEEPAVSPERLSEYYQVVQEAISAGVSPGMLQKVVRILGLRDDTEQ